MDVKKKLEWNIKKVYILSVIFGFAFFYNEIFALYYQNFGLSFTQIGIILLVTALTGLLFEIPTGAFADLYGRKNSCIVGSITYIIGMLIIASSSKFAFFLIAAVFMGFSWSFFSGAFNALVYNSLKELGREKSYLKVMSTEMAIFTCMCIISGFFGPYLFSFNPRIPYYISLTGSIFYLIGILTIYDPKVNVKKKFDLKSHYIQMKEGLKFALNHSKVLWLILFFVSFVLITLAIGNVITGPFVIEKGFSYKGLGIIMLIAASMQAFLILFTPKIEEKIGEQKSFILIVLGMAITVLSFALLNNYLIAIALGLFWFFSSFKDKVIDNYLNTHLEESNRATVLSVNAMGSSFGQILFFPILGILIDKTSLFITVLALSGMAFVLGSILLYVRYSKRVWTSLD